jgi:hypothetical protein
MTLSVCILAMSLRWQETRSLPCLIQPNQPKCITFMGAEAKFRDLEQVLNWISELKLLSLFSSVIVISTPSLVDGGTAVRDR